MTHQNLDTRKGQAVYNPVTLGLYDLWVLGITNRWMWQCPTSKIGQQFVDYAGEHHADIGVGTGYLLQHYLPAATEHLVLIDLNPDSLKFAANRAKEFKPVCYKRDIYQPIEIKEDKFDSISINYLLHCLPGAMSDKVTVFENIAPLLKAEGVLFGSTVLGQGVTKNWAAKNLMGIYNQRGIFSNQKDSLEALSSALKQVFSEVNITMKGCVALFQAKKPKDVG